MLLPVPVVESTFTSSGFKTFLPNGRSFEAGYPFNTLRTSTQTGSTSSFSEKNKSKLVRKQPPISSIIKVCESGSELTASSPSGPSDPDSC